MTNANLISAEELAAHLARPSLKILDASWYMPAQNRDPKAEFETGHIPGAVFFDIDAVVDPRSTLPHTLASEADFTAAARGLGIDDGDDIIVYDTAGLFSAARVWWNFRLAGAASIRVLDGGLPAWTKIGGRLEQGSPRVPPGNFTAQYDLALVRSFAQVREIVAAGQAASLVDARAAARFRGEGAEPRPGVKSGHIAGSLNVPFAGLLDEAGHLKAPDALRTTFEEAGVDLDGPIVASCGSGVTAAIVALGLAAIGRSDVPIYDGSWSEWGSRDESAPFVATGAAGPGPTQ